jgi:adenylylsulfate kinase
MITVWLVGLSSAGKTTIATGLHEKLNGNGHSAELLDGDIIRNNLGGDFTKEGRNQQINRIRYICKILNKHGIVAIVAAITPYEKWRFENRSEIENYLEVFVNAPIEECIRRDAKGLYKRAFAGEIKNMTGVDDPFEKAYNSDIICYTDKESVEESITKVYDKVVEVIDHAICKTRGETGIR